MTDIISAAALYSLTDIAPAFNRGRLGDLFHGIAILTDGENDPAGTMARRQAILGRGEVGDFELCVSPAGFTKREILEFRETLQCLDQGVSIEIGGRGHTLALFSSSVIIDDHEVLNLRLSFDIDPFA